MKNTEKQRRTIFWSIQILLLATIITGAASFFMNSAILPFVAGILAALTLGLALEYNHMEKFK